MTSLFGMTVRAQEPSDEASDELADARSSFAEYIYDRAMEELLAGATLEDGSESDFVVDSYKSYSRVEDLEIAAAMSFSPIRVTVRHAAGRSLRYQIQDVVSASFPIDEEEALRRLAISTVTLSEAQCPGLRQVRERVSRLRIALPLPPRPTGGIEEVTVFLHPRVFGIEIKGDTHRVQISAVDPGVEAYTLAKSTLDIVRACEAKVRPASGS